MRGLFRDEDGWVRVRFDDGRELDMPKARYVALKRQPPFDELPLMPEDDAPSVAREGAADR